MPKVDCSTLDGYRLKVCVAGSRGFDNYDEFKYWLEEALIKTGYMVDRDVIISGCASKGADAMVIRWCRETPKRNWVEVPADWDALGKRAGMVRNTVMSKMCTHLVAFWDGRSPGTKHMIESAASERAFVLVYLIDKLK